MPSTPTPRRRPSRAPPTRQQAVQELLDRAVEPVAANPDAARSASSSCAPTHDRVIDEVSADILLDAYGVVDTRPGPVGRRVLGGLPRRAPRRDHRHPAPQRGQGAAHRLRRHQAAGRPDQPAAAQLDPGPHLERLRGHRRRPGPAQRPAHPDRPRVAAPLYASGSTTSWCRTPTACGSGTPPGWPSRSRRATTFTDMERWWLDRMVDGHRGLRRHRRRRPRRGALHRAGRRRRGAA